MSSSVVLRGGGLSSRSVRDSRTAGGVPIGPFPESHMPPRGLAHHVRLRAPGSAEDEAQARVADVALPDPARIAEDIQLDLPAALTAEDWNRVAAWRKGVDPVGPRLLALRARLRGRTDP
jgi:hypothetical protein